ncbi:ABC transporter ATP-binding protein [bacterium]|nr:ABC transporter ATP-binding protein [bacterium]
MNIVSVENVVKIYHTGMKRGNITALNEVSLSIDQAEIFGLLGPNGAGKTTLMKVLLGITRATSGGVTVMGLSPADAGSREKVGYLPENHRFPNHLTGIGLLELAGRMCGMSNAEIKTRADELLPLVGMDKWAHTKIRKYSKGMAQRIGLAQALINDPDLVCLDEPTDGVDPVGKIEIREVLQRIKEQGKSVLLNSHLLSEVESVADRVAILSKGRVRRVDTVKHLTSRQLEYEFEAEIGDRFLDIPPEIGKQVAVTANGMRVELKSREGVTHIIDMLRQRRINIYAVTPVKMSLEQSFIELIKDQATPGGQQSGGGAS